MIKVISECMITLNGKDVIRQLVLDDLCVNACKICMYRDWHPSADIDELDCGKFHNCGSSALMYFRIKQ